MQDAARRIAIIGFGPRGLGALEAIVRQAKRRDRAISVDLFDSVAWPAAGPNFSPDEPDTCLLNLPLRSIDVAPPDEESFAGFTEWLGAEGADGEAYLPRARLGAYLDARFADLMADLPPHVSVTLHPLRVDAAMREGEGWRLDSGASDFGPYDHVLMSLGQPDTRDDDQLTRWRTHADDAGTTLIDAYPAATLIAAAPDWAGQVVAIRGFGLSALDVVRTLTVGLGGRFEDDAYIPSGCEPALMVPFSLNRHAPAPKPVSADLDARFDPLPDENAAFREALAGAVAEPAKGALDTLAGVLVAPAMRILSATGARSVVDEVRAWLDAELEQPGSQETRGTVEAIRAGLAEAGGHAVPSPGYVIGQLWRKWQPLLRRIYDSRPVPAETAAAITGFDEGLKRYSYGAPAGVLSRLLTLIEAGRVDPRAADDPDITLVGEGWLLQSDDRSVTASVMVDSVLAPAVLDKVAEPLVTGLRQTSGLAALSDGLGARCAPDGAVLDGGGKPVPGLWLAGRLANGSTVANDSIHDCFGPVLERWARAVLET